ncbi:GGDEF domain-containing response regulator [Pseudoalteromonas xiamenensis]|uniref:diguanylate cyclase n=1 Tax=Pseudoalteromonas xiamenensis TaxID=882626 RepID=A0A975DJX3_9GAMM|nr:diguanylate cyclase [Pseudoalteromonas xiamenensis]QTH72904.1 diguanylate cyclase [Pseudoalteromonas xiamenensis]
MVLRALIIEDTPTIAKVQKHIAISVGYAVDIAATLEEAKALIKQHSYYCAVVDFILPDAPNGEAIPVTIKADIPTIVMTGNIDESTRTTVERYPIIDYITKEHKQAYHYLKKQLQRLPKNKQISILIVEDSISARHYIKTLLVRQKYRVYEANDGEHALQVLAENPEISVIITDFEMPKLNGAELCVEVRRKHNDEDIAIIGISSSEQAQLSARFIKSGANDYLRKPFNNEEFYCRLSQNVDMLENIATIRRQANTDYRTDLPNRRYFFEEAKKQLRVDEKAQNTVCLAMLDIDHFKSINDNHGHDAGDAVLKGFSAALTKFFPNDLIARMGGEEFAIKFTKNDKAEAQKQLTLFIQYIEKNSRSFSEYAIPFTVSAGLTDEINHNLDTLLKHADVHLYQAKESGRNRLVS